ncbi:MAG: RluA family pseudouridine synthase [Bacteroidales bacterium]|nr:RluA family pseudouridine synthase [Bacteroidales bacterium]
MALDILFEDNHLIVVNKEPGALVQGDKTGDISLIDDVKSFIKIKYKKPGDVFLGLPHRLDRPTSGIVIMAKTSKALTRLNKMFANHEIKKTYWAVVEEAPEILKQTLEHYLVKDEKTNKTKAYDKPGKNTKHASLSYELIGSTKHYHLLEIELHTGRHHQIRAQLAKIGCHIKGDLKYGSKRSNEDGGIHLHARKVEFIHPVQKENMTIVAKPPNEQIWNIFRNQQ